jgi:hypothetical protein
VSERLAAADFGSAGWQRDLAVSYGRVAMVEARQGARDLALRGFRNGRGILARLKAQSPDDQLPEDLAWFGGIQQLPAEFPAQRNREFPNAYQGKFFKEQGIGALISGARSALTRSCANPSRSEWRL